MSASQEPHSYAHKAYTVSSTSPRLPVKMHPNLQGYTCITAHFQRWEHSMLDLHRKRYCQKPRTSMERPKLSV
eukprot:3239172-Ditylum_brightwellii.AAC.2